MSRLNQNFPRHFAVILIFELLFFASGLVGLALYFQPVGKPFFIQSILLFTTIFSLSILLTFLKMGNHFTTEKQAFLVQLKEEKTQKNILREKLGKDIETRTFELQRIVGALNREIGERTQAEEEIRTLQKLQSLILDSAGEGILGLDNNGCVIFMNSAAEVMLGWTRKQLLGHQHHEYIHHTHPDGTPHHVEDCPIYMAYRDGQIHYKTGDIFWCENGSTFPVEYVSTPIRDRGLLTGAVVVFRDMTTFN